MSQSVADRRAFIPVGELLALLPPAFSPWLDALTDLGLLPRYGATGELLLPTDAARARAILQAVLADDDPRLDPSGPFWPGWPQRLPLRHGVYVEFLSDPAGFSPSLRGALAALAQADEIDGPLGEQRVAHEFLGPATFNSRSRLTYERAIELTSMDRAVTDIAASRYAGSAHYMGSKRQLAGFLVTALTAIAAPEVTVVDLMCGSGAAAAAFARRWPTLAADAEGFAVHLAKVQGGGMTPDRAATIIDRLGPEARRNADRLHPALAHHLDVEEELLHGEAGSRDRSRLRRFLDELPTFPAGASASGWDPVAEVRRRQLGESDLPWCLFTAYFANVYFGLRQCIEIDSLRYAVSRLDDPDDRAWALGALVSTVSSIAITYGGHFAQPVAIEPEQMTDQETAAFLDRRARGVFFEFTVRLRALATESLSSAHPIETVHSPWPQVMAELDTRFGPGEAVVYVDAPYKREEYSRYYHVLETLVAYDYPTSSGKGRMPTKAGGRRFASPFATRDRRLLEATFASLVQDVLARGWPCAWSYSDNAAASIVTVIDRVKSVVECQVSSVSTPYVHKRQGGHQSRSALGGRVTEYLIMVEPK